MTSEARATGKQHQDAAALGNIRVEIDAIDDQMHQLLMRRAELVRQVAETKRLPDGTLPKGAYRPAREANIIRRLHIQNCSPLPFDLVFSLWRQMIGAFTAMQSTLSVSVQAQAEQGDRRDLLALTREHFGASAKLTPRESFGLVANDIQSEAASIGVASAQFEGEREGAWWTACMSRDASAPRVIAALPFYGSEIAGYCVGRAVLESTGDDETLLAVQLDQATSRSGIASALSRAEIDASPLHSSGENVLIRVAGYHVEPKAQMHRSIAEALKVPAASIAVVGAYATPIRPIDANET